MVNSMGGDASGSWSRSLENENLPSFREGDFRISKFIRLSLLQTIMHRNLVSTEAELGLVKSRSGNCDGLVNAMHITASVFINDDESGLHHDYDRWLEKIAPHEPVNEYRDNDTGEDNADAHMKRQIMGREVLVAITNGQLDFGTWEQIFYGEFDGKRKKRVLVKIIGD